MELTDILKASLKESQREQANKLVKRKHAILVEKAGKGKTYTVLSAFAYHYIKGNIKNILVLTPRNAFERRVWKLETSKMTNLKSIDIETLQDKVGNNPAKLKHYLDEYQVIYGKHTHIYKVYELILKILINQPKNALVLDEIHAFRNPVAKLHLTMVTIVCKAQAVWGLTATPLSKDMDDVYSVINLVKPWYLGSKEEFKRNYCKIEKQVIGRYPNGVLKYKENIVGIVNEFLLQQKMDGIVIKGASQMNVKWNYVPYSMSSEEKYIYKKIAKGVFAARFEQIEEAAEWFKAVMQAEDENMTRVPIKETKRHSSRFLYLQYAADGVLSKDGMIGQTAGQKISTFASIIELIASKGQSAIVYFSYYAPMHVFERVLRRRLGDRVKIVHSTGKKGLKPGDISEAAVAQKPHIVLATKSGSESDSFYYINNVVLFHNPTTPETFTQIVGRITRINSKFPDDLNVYLSKVENVDFYKLAKVTYKATQMEIVVNEENNIPPHFKDIYRDSTSVNMIKKYLLWDFQ